MEGFRRSTLAEKPPERPSRSWRPNSDDEWARRPRAEAEEDETKEWFEKQTQPSREFSDRVSHQEQMQNYARNLLDFRKKTGPTEITALPIGRKARGRQLAIQFLEHYFDAIDFDGIGNVPANQFENYSVYIIKNTMELDNEYPSKGLEFFLQKKKKAAA